MAGAAIRLTIKLWRSVQCGAGESNRQQGARLGSASDEGAEAAQWRQSEANGAAGWLCAHLNPSSLEVEASLVCSGVLGHPRLHRNPVSKMKTQALAMREQPVLPLNTLSPEWTTSLDVNLQTP